MLGSGDPTLSADRRAAWLAAAVAAPVDVVVVGGGITGAGAALDAASRGLSTVLLEAEDLAFGTSRWSSKLAHGGLRYLASGDIGVAYESAVERGRLLANAPHLVRAAPTLLPLLPPVTAGSARKIGIGFGLGDLLRRAARTPGAELGRPCRLTAAATHALAPALPAAAVRGGVVMFDGQLTDDARLVTTVARTAAREGAAVITGCHVRSIDGGRVVFHDAVSGADGELMARAVIDATGVWAPQLDDQLRLSPSRGTHVVLSSAALPGLRANLTLPYPGARNRYLLVLPQLDGRILLGLTDVATDTVDDVPTPAPWEVEELTGALAAALGTPLEPAHVLGAFAGLRPLLTPAGGGDPSASADLSRRHAVLRSDGGVVHVVGGKLTTYRRMAQDAVDAAIEHAALTPASPCRTQRMPLVGAAPRTQLASLVAELGEAGLPPLPAADGVGAASTAELLVARYGTEARAVAALLAEESAWREPAAVGGRVLTGELLWSARHEGPRRAADLLDRRFRLGFHDADRRAAEPAARAAIDAAIS